MFGFDITENPFKSKQIRYKAIQRAYDTRFDPSDEAYFSTSVSSNPNGPIYDYTINDLDPASKYEFLVSGRTSVGSGEYASVEVFTKAFTGIVVLLYGECYKL